MSNENTTLQAANQIPPLTRSQRQLPWASPDVRRLLADNQLSILRAAGVDEAAPVIEVFRWLAVHERLGLDPLTSRLYLVKYSGKWTVDPGIDVIRALAARSGQLAGIDAPTYGEDVVGQYCEVTVYRRNAGSYTGRAYRAEWTKGKSPTWAAQPAHMLSKCAEKLAFRLGFADVLQGIDCGDAADPTAVQSDEYRTADRARELTAAVAPPPAPRRLLPPADPADGPPEYADGYDPLDDQPDGEEVAP